MRTQTDSEDALQRWIATALSSGLVFLKVFVRLLSARRRSGQSKGEKGEEMVEVTVVQLGAMVALSAVGGMLLLALVGIASSYGVRKAVSASVQRALDRRAAFKHPPASGEPMTAVVTDLEGSTRLWDLYPEGALQTMRMLTLCDTPLHHQLP